MGSDLLVSNSPESTRNAAFKKIRTRRGGKKKKPRKTTEEGKSPRGQGIIAELMMALNLETVIRRVFSEKDPEPVNGNVSVGERKGRWGGGGYRTRGKPTIHERLEEKNKRGAVYSPPGKGREKKGPKEKKKR